MYFRLTKKTNLHIDQTTTVPFAFTDPYPISVEFKKVMKEGIHPVQMATCFTTAQPALTPEVKAALGQLSLGKWPQEYPQTEWLTGVLKDIGQLKGLSLFNLSYFPQEFQCTIRDVQEVLAKVSRRVVGLLNWRLGTTNLYWGADDAEKFEWSSDKSVWFEVWADTLNQGEVIDFRNLSNDSSDPLNQVVKETNKLPIGHELMAEAWQLRFSNPRSSLVIAVAALESGLKETIVTLVPQTEWLALEAPSPPVVKMLKNYLPTLPAKNGKPLVPPTILMKAAGRAVELRNDIIHTGESAPGKEELVNLLIALRELLWLCDYYRGYEWALEFMREDVRNLLAEPKRQ